MSDDRTIKRCACGQAWTLEGWRSLFLAGRLKDEVEDLELRTCTCGSTIALVVEYHDGDSIVYRAESEKRSDG